MWRLARYTLAVVVSLLVVRPAAVFCQSLDDLSLADLMKLDAGQVYGAAERMQPVTEAPASVSFITADEIAQFGYRTLADVLRAVRGMYVTDDRNFSLLGTRGFGKPGDYNSRILLLINGHRFNDNVFGQAEIGSELGIDAAMFERVEIIRGPASSLYGDSAFFAVVNVITRSGASLAGGAVTLEAGTLGTRLVRVTTGHREHDVDLAVSGTFESSDGVNRLYFPAFDTPATNNGYAEGLDGERVGQFYSRLSFKGLTVTGAYGSRRRDVPTASFGTIFNYQDDPERTTDRHTLVDAEYVRLVGSTRFTMRGAYDRFSYDGVYPTAVPDQTTPNIKTNFVVGARWSASAGATHALPGSQTLRAGVEFIDNLRQDQWGFESGTLALDIKASSTQHAFYAQDEIRPAKWLLVTAGLRYDGYEEFSRVSPRAAVILVPSASASIKYLYGNAFRAPSQYEGTTFFFGDRVRALRPETIDTHELVWERYTNDWLRTSVSAYWYKADQLITAIADESTYLHVSFENENEVHAKGLEFEAQMRLKGRVQAWANYALQTATERNTDSALPNSPQHIAKLRVSVPGPVANSSIAVEGWLVSSRRTLAGSDVGMASSVNVSLLQPLGTRFELFATVRNLLDRRYEDPVSAQHQQDAIPQNPRTARVGVRVKLWD